MLYTMLKALTFTLIELLVVIAIIAILAAMLMPALARARNQEIRVRCVGKLRNLHYSLMSYANDFDEWGLPWHEDEEMKYRHFGHRTHW